MNKHFFVGFMVLAACGVEQTDTGPEDGESDRYVGDGKADTGGIQDGTDDALGILHVVNTLTEAQLKNDANLATTAASNIVAYRKGDDETAGTADDQQFETLAELDSVPFVGPVAFGKLLAFAEAEGYTDDPPVVAGSDDPFDPNACAGAPMSQAAAKARWQSNAVLGSYQLAIRERSSSTATDWTPVSLSDWEWRTRADGQLKLASYDGTIKLQMLQSLCYEYGAYISPAQYVDGAVCTGVGHTLYCGTYGRPDQCNAGGFEAYDLPNGYAFAMEGKLTENCAQLHDVVGRNEVAILVRF